jgi:hypothetical protein
LWFKWFLDGSLEFHYQSSEITAVTYTDPGLRGITDNKARRSLQKCVFFPFGSAGRKKTGHDKTYTNIFAGLGVGPDLPTIHGSSRVIDTCLMHHHVI